MQFTLLGKSVCIHIQCSLIVIERAIIIMLRTFGFRDVVQLLAIFAYHCQDNLKPETLVIEQGTHTAFSSML